MNTRNRQKRGLDESKDAASMRLSNRKFVRCVEEAMGEIPPHLVQYLRDVTVDVESTPDARTCRDAGVDDPRDLFGLYRGMPLTHRGIEQDGRLPDRITIYKRNIERMCSTRSKIIHEIRRTVLHEVGHHFGLDEDELTALGYE